MKSPIILLAGGLGTRLRAVESMKPKAMTDVLGLPFLHRLIDHLEAQGFRDFILSAGFRGDMIEDYLWDEHFPRVKVRVIKETTPLGTGGAVASIFKQLKLKQAWTANADTWIEDALPNPEDFDAFFTGFEPSPDFIANLPGNLFDSGATFIRLQAIERAQLTPPFSVHELLAPTVHLEKAGYARLSGTCYDIGTPERLERFKRFIAEKAT